MNQLTFSSKSDNIIIAIA